MPHAITRKPLEVIAGLVEYAILIYKLWMSNSEDVKRVYVVDIHLPLQHLRAMMGLGQVHWKRTLGKIWVCRAVCIHMYANTRVMQRAYTSASRGRAGCPCSTVTCPSGLWQGLPLPEDSRCRPGSPGTLPRGALGGGCSRETGAGSSGSR